MFLQLIPRIELSEESGSIGLNSNTSTHTQKQYPLTWQTRMEWDAFICITSTCRSDWEKVVASEWTMNTEPRVTPCMLPGSQHQNTKLWIKQNTDQSDDKQGLWNASLKLGKDLRENMIGKNSSKRKRKKYICVCIFITNDFAFSSSSMH